jgi:hypothetical protein
MSYEISQELINLLRSTVETLSIEFTRWDEQHVVGPSLYFLVVTDANFDDYTDLLGANKWPTDQCDVVCEPDDALKQRVKWHSIATEQLSLLRTALFRSRWSVFGVPAALN